MKILFSPFGTLLVCVAVGWVTAKLAAVQFEFFRTYGTDDPNDGWFLEPIKATLCSIAGCVMAVFALLFIHLVLK